MNTDLVARTIGIEQVHGGVGDAARFFERGRDALDHVLDIDDAGQIAAHGFEAAAELGALAQ